METFLWIVPWLALLACPLMMLVMMRMMPGASCHRRPADAQGSDGNDEEIRQLQARIAELEAKNQAAEVGR